MSESERIKEELASENDYLRAENAYLTKENRDLEYELNRWKDKYDELAWRLDNQRMG